jgi:hypothetical protein
MKPEIKYNATKSITGHVDKKVAFPLSYGSADL